MLGIVQDQRWRLTLTLFDTNDVSVLMLPLGQFVERSVVDVDIEWLIWSRCESGWAV